MPDRQSLTTEERHAIGEAQAFDDYVSRAKRYFERGQYQFAMDWLAAVHRLLAKRQRESREAKTPRFSERIKRASKFLDEWNKSIDFDAIWPPESKKILKSTDFSNTATVEAEVDPPVRVARRQLHGIGECRLVLMPDGQWWAIPQPTLTPGTSKGDSLAYAGYSYDASYGAPINIWIKELRDKRDPGWIVFLSRALIKALILKKYQVGAEDLGRLVRFPMDDPNTWHVIGQILRIADPGNPRWHLTTPGFLPPTPAGAPPCSPDAIC